MPNKYWYKRHIASRQGTSIQPPGLEDHELAQCPFKAIHAVPQVNDALSKKGLLWGDPAASLLLPSDGPFGLIGMVY